MTTSNTTVEIFSITNPNAKRFHHIVSFSVIVKDGVYYSCTEQVDFTEVTKTTRDKARTNYSFYRDQGFEKSIPLYTDINYHEPIPLVRNKNRV